MGVLIDPDFSEQRALEYGYRVIEFMKKRSLKNAKVEINFYPRSLIEHLGDEIKSPEDLKPFIIIDGQGNELR